jgi:hypothetical protein
VVGAIVVLFSKAPAIAQAVLSSVESVSSLSPPLYERHCAYLI